jgi:hypothetical protein
MNINEECLLLYLNNPDRISVTIDELVKYINNAHRKAPKDAMPQNILPVVTGMH